MIIGMYQGRYHSRSLLKLLRNIPRGSTCLRITFHETGETTLAGLTGHGPATWSTRPISSRGQLTLNLTEHDLDQLHEQICRVNAPTVWIYALPHGVHALSHRSAA